MDATRTSWLSSKFASAERIGRRFVINSLARARYSMLIHNNADTRYRKVPLTRKQKARIREYSYDRFGSASFSPWLYFYSAFRGSFVEGWIPDDFFGQHLLPTINKSYRQVAGAKTLTRRLLTSDALPDLAYYVNGMWFDREWARISTEGAKSLIFSGGPRVFLKADVSRGGRGVMLVSESEFDLLSFPRFRDFVVQKPIEQASWFYKLFPNCITTLRLLTMFTPECGAHLKAGYLRIGSGDARYISLENSFLRCPILDAEGNLAPEAVDERLRITERHPDTGYVFADGRVPNYQNAVSLCTGLHARMPTFMIIGWDVAITEGGQVQIMEWNAGHPAIWFVESSLGPIFKGMGMEAVGRHSAG